MSSRQQFNRQGEEDSPDDVQNQPDSPSSADDTALLVPASSSRPQSSPGRYYTFPGLHSKTAIGSGSFQDDSASPTPGPPGARDTRSPKIRDNTCFVYTLACFAALGGLLFGYDTGIISGSMLLIQPYFGLSTVWQEAIVSATIGAAAVSALAGGMVCDRLGRRAVIMAASVIFTLGAVVMGAAPGKVALLGGRIIVGVGIGLASVSVPVYIAECSPPDIRGLLVTVAQLFITLGILISSIVAGAFSSDTTTGWRYMLGLAGVPGVIQFCGFLCLPESPRWLVSKGREDEARRVLRRTRGHPDIEDEIREIKEAVVSRQKGFVLGQMLDTPHVRRALIVGCGLQFFQQMCGINTVIYYSGTILKEAGFQVSQAIWLVCIPFSINFLATFVGMGTVERVGRRVLLLSSFLGVTVALVILSLGFLLTDVFSPPVNTSLPVLYPNGSKVTDKCQGYSLCEDCIEVHGCGYCYDANQPELSTCLLAHEEDSDKSAAYGRCSANYTPGDNEHLEWTFGFCPTQYDWVAVLGLALFVLSFAPGLGPMPWTVNSEIYPMWARGTGMALATMVNWVCNLLVSFTFLTLFQTITKYGTFLLFTGISVLGIVFTLLLVPETRHKTLEEMEEVFMTSDQRQQSRQQQQRQHGQQQQQEQRHFSPEERPATLGEGDGGHVRSDNNRSDTKF